jgi:hypothetical protein
MDIDFAFFYDFCFLILELFRRCGIFCFSFLFFIQIVASP